MKLQVDAPLVDNKVRAQKAAASDLYVTESNQSTGAEWSAFLELEFKHNNARGTQLSRNAHRGPLYVQKPFYPEGKQCAHAYLLHPPAGVVSGDELEVRVTAGQDAHALLTTPGAARFYRARVDKTGCEPLLQKTVNHIVVKENACVEWLPCETIIYDGSETDLTTRVDLASKACFMGWEIVCLGLPASNAPFVAGRLKQSFEVYCEELPMLIDRVRFSADDFFRQQAVGLSGSDVFGTFLSGPFLNSSEKELDVLVDQLREIFDADNLASSFSVTRLEQILVVRYLGAETDKASAGFKRAWKVLRPALTQQKAVEPRIWAT